MNTQMAIDIRDGRHVKAAPLASALNMSVQALYDAITRKEVTAIRIGKSIRIPAKEAARLLAIEPSTFVQQQAA